MITIHQGLVDQNGNFRDRSRKAEGYLGPKFDVSKPFPALVTAWFPYSQTINISYWKDWYQTEEQSVVVYGNFMEAVGTLYTPKIATDKGKIKGTDTETNTWQTYKNPNPREEPKSNPNSDEYVLDNHIEALVVKTNVGYAATAFRTITPDSPLLKNAKYGRCLKRHDDGSYHIHDEDGNIQFKHPSGLSVKIGKTGDDIPLDSPLPDHAKNVQDYAGKVIAKIQHPSGSIIDYDDDGLLGMTSGTGENLKIVIDTFIDEVAKIVVNDGVGPDVAALNQIKADILKLLK